MPNNATQTPTLRCDARAPVNHRQRPNTSYTLTAAALDSPATASFTYPRVVTARVRLRHPPPLTLQPRKMQDFRNGAYFRIFVTTPEPTVRPPSRIENRNPSSIAIGAINS